MGVQKQNGNCLKAVCSVSQMARAIGLSRASFYAYVKRGVFLAPIYSLMNKRPFYTADMQAENLAARQTGIGANGQYVIWYEKTQPAAGEPTRQPVRRERYASLLDRLKALGLDKLTAAQVEEAVAANFPDGVDGVEEDVVLRVVNRHFRRTGLGS
jgi:hypothetical protein